MKADLHVTDLFELKRANAQQRMVILGLVALSILLAFKVLAKDHTVVLEPPSRAQEIGMTGDRVDAGWLEEMGSYIAHLMLDVTPASVGWQQAQILRWTHPDLHGDLQQRMTAQAKRITESNATTSFWPQQVAADPDQQRVIVMGQLDTLVNGTRTSSDTVAYRADFQSKGGRVLLKGWTEVPRDDPWLVKAMVAVEHNLKGKKK